MSLMSSIGFGLALIGTMLAAQEPATQRGARAAQFSYLGAEAEIEEPLYYGDGDKFTPLEFQSARRSEKSPLGEMKSFALYRKVASETEGEFEYQMVAESGIPKTLTRILFIIVPTPGEDQPTYRVKVLDDSAKAFPAGTFCFLNFTAEALDVQYGGETKPLDLDQSEVMKSEKQKKGGAEPCIIFDQNQKPVFGTRVFGQPSGRELVFINPPKKEGGRTRVRFVSELMPQTLSQE